MRMNGMKTINCTKCHKRNIPVNDNWAYSLCPTCHLLQREKSSTKKQLRKKQKEERLEREIQSGGLNAGMKPAPFMSWQRYKQLFPHRTFHDYLRDKTHHQKSSGFLEYEIPKELRDIPVSSEDCNRFRRMLLNQEVQDKLWMGIHHNSCLLCGLFYGTWRDNYRMEGVNFP
jgi:hypothetical protein